MNENIRMARIYLHEARQTKWPNWKITLLGYAASRRIKAIEELREKKRNAENNQPKQRSLF